MTPSVFYAAKQQCCPIFESDSTWIKYRVDLVRPVSGGQNRVRLATPKKFNRVMVIVHGILSVSKVGKTNSCWDL